MSDPGLEPGDARLVELALAVHDILLSELILGQSNVDSLCSLSKGTASAVYQKGINFFLYHFLSLQFVILEF